MGALRAQIRGLENTTMEQGADGGIHTNRHPTVPFPYPISGVSHLLFPSS